MELGCKQQEDVNMTRAEEALSPWLNNPRRTIIQVEVLVVTATVLLLLQFIFGSCKRRWHNYFVKGGLWVSNTLMFPLILYTLSMMQSSPIKNSSYPVWAVVLIIASSGTTAARQYDFYASSLNLLFSYVSPADDSNYLEGNLEPKESDASYVYQCKFLLGPSSYRSRICDKGL
ncbi:unnamed protein product [Urochloa humidicola]